MSIRSEDVVDAAVWLALLGLTFVVGFLATR